MEVTRVGVEPLARMTSVSPISERSKTMAASEKRAEEVNGENLEHPEYYLDLDKVREVIKRLNETADTFHKRLSFELDHEMEHLLVKVIDTRTQEVIRQIPPEAALEVSRRIDQLIGLFIDERA